MDSNNQSASRRARFPKFPLFIAAALLLLFLVRGLHTQVEERSGWNDSSQQVLAKAKEEGKRVLMDFTGSDWCAGCIKLDREVFSTPEFKDYAAKNLVLWELDFPRQKYIDPSILKQNRGVAAAVSSRSVSGGHCAQLRRESGRHIGLYGGRSEGVHRRPREAAQGVIFLGWRA